MAELQLSLLSSVSQLRDNALAWDDLWLRSDVTLPTLQAEFIAQWVEQFAPKAQFRAIVIQSEGQFVAALPLVGKKIRGLLEAGSLPSNEWSPCGDLLLDPTADTEKIAEKIALAIDQLPWPLLWFDAIASDTPRWQALLTALEQLSMASDLHSRFQIAWIPTSGDWEETRSSWSAKHRSNMGRYERRLEKHGSVQLNIDTPKSSEEVEQAMNLGFQIEDSNWKGRQGSSVLKSEGMLKYFVRQAQQLALRDQLQLCFLNIDESPVAFIYGGNTKGVFHGFKTGYDEKFSKDCPGQMLIHHVLHQMYEDPHMQGMDCLGPVSPAISRWQGESYGLSRLVIAPRRLLGRGLLAAYKHLAPQWRRIKQRTSS